jgi:hypothetical protein
LLIASIGVPEIGPDHLGVGQNLAWRAFCNLGAAVHHDAAITQAADRVHDVLDDDDGAAFGTKLLDQGDTGAQLGRVEAGEPFIEQQHLGIGRQRSRQLQPLLVDIGERGHRAVGRSLQPDPPQQATGIVIELAAPPPAVAEHATGGDVFQHGQRRQDAHDLKGACDATGGNRVGRRSGNVIAVQPDRAGARLQRAGDHVQHGGLAGTVRADQSQHFVFRQIERNAVDGDQTAEPLADALDRQRRDCALFRHGGFSGVAAGRRSRHDAAPPGLRSGRPRRAG